MTPSLTMNWEQPWRPHFAVYELAGRLRELPCDLRGLIHDFRDYAWVHFGLPSEQEELESIAMSFRFSRYKFRKYWSTLRKFFTESDGRLFYPDDEHHRSETRQKYDKAREYGRIGAEIKRQRQSTVEFASQKFSTSPPSGTLEHTDSRDRDRLCNTAAVEETSDLEQLAGSVAAADSKSTSCPNTHRMIASVFAGVTPEFISRLLAASQKIYPHVTDDDIALAVRSTFKPGRQKTAGLFLETVPAWLQNQPNRKPPESTLSVDSMGRKRSASSGG